MRRRPGWMWGMPLLAAFVVGPGQGCGSPDVHRAPTPAAVNDTEPPDDGAKDAASGQPGPGPIPLAIGGGGFVLVSEQPGEQRYSSPPGSACMVEIAWWRPRPTETGGPMMVAGSRQVTVAGQAYELVTTEMFEGVERQVDALFLADDSWTARVVFTDCGPTEEDAFLESISPRRGPLSPDNATP